jgi:hypothetical protein
MLNSDVISMPDKWEYPWYAAWDLVFHTVSLSLVDFDFAKEQLLLMLRSLYFHTSGQIPAYEWNFSDVNPPAHAWAPPWLYRYERQLGRAHSGAPIFQHPISIRCWIRVQEHYIRLQRTLRVLVAGRWPA